MFGSIGMPELVIIFVIALIIFGPRKLPELGRSLGKSIGEFKKASNELRSTLEEEIRIEDQSEQREKMRAEQDTAIAAASTQPTGPAPPVDRFSASGRSRPALVATLGIEPARASGRFRFSTSGRFRFSASGRSRPARRRDREPHDGH